MKHRQHAARVRARIRRHLGTQDIVYDWRQGVYRHAGPHRIVEVSARVDRRIERLEVELRNLVNLIRRKSGPWSYSAVVLPLLAAMAQVKDARSRYVVPLLQARGLP